jgi:hypothetical protein
MQLVDSKFKDGNKRYKINKQRSNKRHATSANTSFNKTKILCCLKMCRRMCSSKTCLQYLTYILILEIHRERQNLKEEVQACCIYQVSLTYSASYSASINCQTLSSLPYRQLSILPFRHLRNFSNYHPIELLHPPTFTTC